jgi:hypothetical protein
MQKLHGPCQFCTSWTCHSLYMRPNVVAPTWWGQRGKWSWWGWHGRADHYALGPQQWLLLPRQQLGSTTTVRWKRRPRLPGAVHTTNQAMHTWPRLKPTITPTRQSWTTRVIARARLSAVVIRVGHTEKSWTSSTWMKARNYSVSSLEWIISDACRNNNDACSSNDLIGSQMMKLTSCIIRWGCTAHATALNWEKSSPVRERGDTLKIA